MNQKTFSPKFQFIIVQATARKTVYPCTLLRYATGGIYLPSTVPTWVSLFANKLSRRMKLSRLEIALLDQMLILVDSNSGVQSTSKP